MMYHFARKNVNELKEKVLELGQQIRKVPFGHHSLANSSTLSLPSSSSSSPSSSTTSLPSSDVIPLRSSREQRSLAGKHLYLCKLLSRCVNSLHTYPIARQSDAKSRHQYLGILLTERSKEKQILEEKIKLWKESNGNLNEMYQTLRNRGYKLNSKTGELISIYEIENSPEILNSLKLELGNVFKAPPIPVLYGQGEILNRPVTRIMAKSWMKAKYERILKLKMDEKLMKEREVELEQLQSGRSSSSRSHSSLDGSNSNDSIPKDKKVSQEEQGEQPKKKGFFGRLFSGGSGEKEEKHINPSTTTSPSISS